MSVAPELAERALYSADELSVLRLFLAKTIQPHHFGAFARLRRFVRGLGGRRGGNNGQSGCCRNGGELGLRGFRGDVGLGRFELQSELHRSVEEALDRS